MSATHYKRPHVDIFICIEMPREKNLVIKKTHPVYYIDLFINFNNGVSLNLHIEESGKEFKCSALTAAAINPSNLEKQKVIANHFFNIVVMNTVHYQLQIC